MKQLLLSALLAVLFLNLSSQNTSVDLTWARGIGSSTNDKMNTSCTDASGNIYITGKASYSMDFDPSFTTYTLNATGNAYLAKYDQAGNFVWAKVFAGTSTSEGKGVGVDGSGNVYLCVKYSGGDINTDPMASNITYTATGDEMFIEKFTSAGASVWTYSIGGGFSSFMKPENMVVNNAGDFVLVGAFTPSPVVDFNPAGPSLTVTTVAYSYDGFVAKYNSSGVCQWAFNLGDTQNDYVYGVTMDATGNVYVTGSFQGSPDFDPLATTSLVTSFGFSDGFIAKYTSTGALAWAGGIGGLQAEDFVSISLDNSGNVLVSGVMQSATVDADMGASSLVLTKVGSGNLDLFVGKYLSATGAVIWANNTGGTFDVAPLSVTSDTQNNVYMAGYFGGIADFDISAAAVSNMTAITTSGGDAFISKYTPGGAFIYAKQIGGGTSVSNQVSRISVDNSNNILITGMHSYSVDVDFNSTNTIPAFGGSDIFFVKYSQCIDAGTPTIAVTNQTMCANSVATLSIAGGQLNSATNWVWASVVCGSGTIGVGPTVTVNPVFLTQYFVRGEGGCTTPGMCASATVDVAPLKGITGTVTAPGPTPAPGYVQLFRYEGPLTKWDSVTYQNVNASGIYSFNAVNSGSYIIMCIPTATDLVKTYAPSNATWKNATIFSHGCITDFNVNINVVPMLTFTPGPGVLAGKIVEGVNYGGKGVSVSPGNPIGGLTIKGGKNPGGGIVAQGRTNAAGEYTFTGLPLSAAGETYFIFVDIPGVDTAGTHHKAITTGTTMYTDLDFLVDSDYVRPIDYTGIKEIALEGERVVVYPNPAADIVYIRLDAKNESNISVELYDILGKKVLSENYQAIQSEFKTSINVATLKRGVYFVKVRLNSGEAMIKLVLSE